MQKINCIALTGGMGTGKSTVLHFFEQHGFTVYDADKIVTSLFIRENNPYYSALSQKFDDWLGSSFSEKSHIDKALLRPYLEQIENGFPYSLEIVKPFVQEKMDSIYHASYHKDKIIFEIPLLFEANMQGHFDKIILITCDLLVRLERIKIRQPHLSNEQILQTINSQKKDNEKIPYSDFIVDNSSTKDKLLIQLNNILPTIEEYYLPKKAKSKKTIK